MSARMKPLAAGLALLGAALALPVFAEKGPDGRGAMLLDRFDAMDTDKDGKLSLAELRAHRTAEFAAADTNADGVLAADELSARQLARFTETLPDRTQRMLDTMDNDGNGSLSEAEIGEGPGERHFARIDTDNDGAISKAEVEAAMTHSKRRGHRGDNGGDN